MKALRALALNPSHARLAMADELYADALCHLRDTGWTATALFQGEARHAQGGRLRGRLRDEVPSCCPDRVGDHTVRAQNTMPISLRFLFWSLPETPLATVILGSVAAGIVLIGLPLSINRWRLRAQARSLEARLAEIEVRTAKLEPPTRHPPCSHKFVRLSSR
jgi:hypothetical protein